MGHQFRFGVMLAEQYGSLPRSMADWTDKVRQIEDLGYSSLLLTDHLETPYAPLPALAAAAAVTTQLRLGTLVLAADFRNPVMLAKDLATVDLLSNGRFELGIGAGWLPKDYVANGIAFDTPGIRIDRLEEQVRLLRRVLSGEPTRHEGRFYHCDVDAEQAKVLQANIPILIGGGGPKLLAAAGRNADIVGVNVPLGSGSLGADAIASASEKATDERIGWIRDAAGDRFDDLELNVAALAIVTADRYSTAAQVGARFGQSAEHILTSPLFLVGSADQLIDQLYQRRARFGFSYVVITGEAEVDFAPVVAALTGR